MKYGKIRIHDGNLIYNRHMRINVLPCSDILWCYMRKEASDSGISRTLPVTNLVVITRRHKSYQFDMTEKEVRECIRLLHALNPEMAIGFPKGGRITQKSLPNTRDLGALMSEDGRYIIPRKLLRSGHLYHCSLWDQDTLKEAYHLTTVIDFRNHLERKRMPDVQMAAVEYHHVSLLDEGVPGLTCEEGILDVLTNYQGDPELFMCDVYRRMVMDAFFQKQVGRFLDLLISQEDGAVLFHDNYGTDRVGIAAALLLFALGIPEKTIREDYLKTNSCLEKEEESLVRHLESRTIVDAQVIGNVKSLFEVKDIYLKSAIDEIRKQYGDMDHYLKKALFLTQKFKEQLQEKYLI